MIWQPKLSHINSSFSLDRLVIGYAVYSLQWLFILYMCNDFYISLGVWPLGSLDHSWNVFLALDNLVKTKKPFTAGDITHLDIWHIFFRLRRPVIGYIFRLKLCLFLAGEIISDILAPLVPEPTQFLQHFLGSKKVPKKTKMWCHVLNFM